ncbi:hypothetical protein EVAR_9254_1 [Eumeta japonica]|uniref:Uncharacterized protein n=1 Tax=Eumeta variegata TaxID=151549 RepID=A0A4C1TNS6_EUMVA|nr:hypothetical protein EVAR_9254_1 [Eumeta japonica]
MSSPCNKCCAIECCNVFHLAPHFDGLHRDSMTHVDCRGAVLRHCGNLVRFDERAPLCCNVNRGKLLARDPFREAVSASGHAQQTPEEWLIIRSKRPLKVAPGFNILGAARTTMSLCRRALLYALERNGQQFL